MVLHVYQTILVGSLTVDETRVAAALNDGDDDIVRDFITRNCLALGGAEIIDQYWTLGTETKEPKQ